LSAIARRRRAAQNDPIFPERTEEKAFVEKKRGKNQQVRQAKSNKHKEVMRYAGVKAGKAYRRHRRETDIRINEKKLS